MARAAQRKRAVPCVNATDYEINLGQHMTLEHDRRCRRCCHILDMFTAMKEHNEAAEETVDA